MNDRIKLAEAMGWYQVTDPDSMTQLGVPDAVYGDVVWVRPDHSEWFHEAHFPFDPFTDANDDYAVLEWMRSLDKDTAFWKRYCDALRDFPEIGLKPAYQIGDYARAALKVIT